MRPEISSRSFVIRSVGESLSSKGASRAAFAAISARHISAVSSEFSSEVISAVLRVVLAAAAAAPSARAQDETSIDDPAVTPFHLFQTIHERYSDKTLAAMSFCL
jgi:hypothetical protein